MTSPRISPRLGRRAVLLGGGACLLGVRDYAPPRLAIGRTTTRRKRSLVDPRAISRVSTGRAEMALTFDDGPDERFTPQVLEILASRDVKATFFLIGRNATEHAGIVDAIVAAGHQVANHTQDHLWLDSEPRQVIEDQIEGARTSLSRLGASDSGLFRPPRGWTSPDVADATVDLGFQSIFWSGCLEAHLSSGIAHAAQTVAQATTAGSIVLCHDGGRLSGPNPQDIDRSQTVAALPQLIDQILAASLTPVTLSRLLALR